PLSGCRADQVCLSAISRNGARLKGMDANSLSLKRLKFSAMTSSNSNSMMARLGWGIFGSAVAASRSCRYPFRMQNSARRGKADVRLPYDGKEAYFLNSLVRIGFRTQFRSADTKAARSPSATWLNILTRRPKFVLSNT